MNRERLIFCCANLVGQKVTASCRNSISYEGVFHSCSLDGDFSVTMRYARLLPNGETVQTLVIPGKDFLQLTALNVAPLESSEAFRANKGQAGFQTDTDISGRKNMGRDRELVKWSAGGDDKEHGGELGSQQEPEGGKKEWDQFTANEHMFGITSTYDENIYTTKLDPSSIPRAKREEADRIAREIEGGQSWSKTEEGEDCGDDEEAKWSSVRRDGGKGGKGSAAAVSSSSKGGAAPSSKKPLSEIPPAPPSQVALTRESLSRHDRGDGFAAEHRAKRGMITAGSPAVSEMKRINALNLEPALPKLDDKTRSDWIRFKQSQARESKAVHGSGLKVEFEKSLEQITRQEASRRGEASPPTGDFKRSGAGGKGSAGADGDASASKFSFNPAAKEFSFNPSAATFTPTSTGVAPAGASPQARQSGPTPQFVMRDTGGSRRTTNDILDSMLQVAKREKVDMMRSEWTEASGPPFREILGRPMPGGAPPLMPGGGPGGPMMQGGWQQQAPGGQMGPQGQGGPGPCQGGPGGPPQGMVPQGYMTTTTGPPGPCGPQGQMFQPMYQGPGGPGGPRPSGPGGPQQGGMPTQSTMATGPQGMTMVPTGQMGGQGGQMGAMPKFGVVPVMMPQYGQQGFNMGNPQQGGPTGPPMQHGPQGQQVMMMGPGGQTMMPMFPGRPMGGGPGGPGPPQGDHQG